MFVADYCGLCVRTFVFPVCLSLSAFLPACLPDYLSVSRVACLPASLSVSLPTWLFT